MAKTPTPDDPHAPDDLLWEPVGDLGCLHHPQLHFAGTTCSNTGNGEVTTNLVHTGACWEDEGHEDGKFCPLTEQCGRLYDCSDDPVLDGGETGDELGWDCDQF